MQIRYWVLTFTTRLEITTRNSRFSCQGDDFAPPETLNQQECIQPGMIDVVRRILDHEQSGMVGNTKTGRLQHEQVVRSIADGEGVC